MYQIFNQIGQRVAEVPAVSLEHARRDFLASLGFRVAPWGDNFEEGDQEQPEELIH